MRHLLKSLTRRFVSPFGGRLSDQSCISHEREQVVSSSYLNERLTQARVLLNDGQRARAQQIWDELYRQYPQSALGSDVGCWLFIDLSTNDVACHAFRLARRREPGNPLFMAADAELLRRQGQPSEAFRLCKTILRRFPQEPHAYRIAAATLDDLQRSHEADVLLDAAVKRFPHDFRLRRNFAERAMKEARWEEALARWKGPYRDFEFPIATISMSKCLCGVGRFGEAERLVADLARRLPGNRALQTELQRLVRAQSP